MTLGEAILLRRSQMGLTQAEAAKMMGVHPSLLSLYENNRRASMTFLVGLKLIRLFNFTVEELEAMVKEGKNVD